MVRRRLEISGIAAHCFDRTEFILLGTLALRTGKVVKWDGPGMTATNAPEAQPFIEGSYRRGWELPV